MDIQYASFMIDRVQAALADGQGFALYFEGNGASIQSYRVASVELDSGAIVVTLTEDNEVHQLLYRFDQLTCVTLDAPPEG